MTDAAGDDTPAPRADAAAGETDADEDGPVGGRPCPRCERPMYSRHCKYVCPVHGVVFDCADTFY
jgi:hypothetical protein